MNSVVGLASLVVDRYSQVPAHVQIQQQVRFACGYQEVKPGDVLPSIRALGEQLGVGAGVVRRAYRDLCEVGFLANGRRKHVVVAPGSTPVDLDALVRECRQQCEQFIAWGRDKRVSVVVLAHLLLRHALILEAESPSYFFVDTCRLAAQASADTAAKAWGIRIAGLSVLEFTSLSGNAARRPSVVLVNQLLHEAVMATAGETSARVFPVSMRVTERTQRRIRKMPANSRVLLVMADDVFPQTGQAVLRYYRRLFGRRWRFDAKPLGSIRDLTALVESKRYRLCLLAPAVWAHTPSRLGRNGLVARMVDEPDPRSLEETRVAAGVLM